MLASFMQVLDSTITNVAMPYMQGSFQATLGEVTWVLTSYMVSAAIMTAPVGWLSGRFGRKRLFVFALLGFTTASALAGAAQTLDQIVLFRILQGASGAMLSPLSQSLMLDFYPVEQRGTIMSIWGMVVMIGPILGPTLGGFLTENYSWRWVFYLNVPFGIIASLGLFALLPNDNKKEQGRFDLSGFAFFAVAIGALQFMLDRGTTKDWFSSSEIIIEATLAGVGAYLFLVQFFTKDETFIKRKVLKDRNFTSALLMTFFISMTTFANSALLPPYLEELGGRPVLDVGVLMAPRGIGVMISMLFVGRLVMRMDARIPMAVGSVLICWSLWQMSHWTPSVSVLELITNTVVRGIGNGMIFVSANIMAFATLPGELRTDGASVFNLLRNLGGSIGISISQTVLATNAQIVHASLASEITPFNRALSINAQSLLFNIRLPRGLTVLNAIVSRGAMETSYADTYHLLLLLSLASIVMIALIPKPRPTLSARGKSFEVSEG
jgi:DHA2 family multidrug resistance protein